MWESGVQPAQWVQPFRRYFQVVGSGVTAPFSTITFPALGTAVGPAGTPVSRVGDPTVGIAGSPVLGRALCYIMILSV